MLVEPHSSSEVTSPLQEETGEMRELRCDGTLHGVMLDDHVLEVKCHRRICGAQSGVVVLHRFNIDTGEVTTQKYRDPKLNDGGVDNGAGDQPAGLRTA